MLNRSHSFGARAAVILALSLAIPQAIPMGDVIFAASEQPRVDIDNFGRVNPNYYRGAEPDADDYAALSALGIKTLIDLRGEDVKPQEKVLAEQAGMAYVAIPMTTRIVPTPEQIRTFLRVVSDPAQQPVYVHCVGGRHRTGVMTAIYRMTEDRWTPAQAFKEMKTFKFGADFLHPEFKRFVLGFNPQLTLPGLLATVGIKD